VSGANRRIELVRSVRVTLGCDGTIAEGVFIADLFETTGNIWMTTLPRMQQQ